MTSNETTIELPTEPSHAETDPTNRPSEQDEWPVQSGYSTQSGADQGQHPVTCGYPEPSMQMLTEEEFRRQMGHPPKRADNCGITTDVMSWIDKTARTAFARQPDDVTVAAMDTISKLLNGKPVKDPNGRTRHRLLSETPPELSELLTPAQFAAVDPAENKPASTGISQQAVEKEFGDLQWYEIGSPNYRTLLEEQHIAGMKRRYHVTPYGKKWVQTFADESEYDIEELRPEGGLTHRFGTGLFALHQLTEGASNVKTYQNVKTSNRIDNVDVYAQREINGNERHIVSEVIGRHHNRQLDARTYEKTKRLSARGFLPVYVFANIDRAKTVLRKWMREGDLHLDKKIDTYDIERLRECLEETHLNDPDTDIPQFWTVSKLHEHIFQDPPSPAVIDDLEW